MVLLTSTSKVTMESFPINEEDLENPEKVNEEEEERKRQWQLYEPNRRHYSRTCRKLGIPPLSRLIRQLGSDTLELNAEGLRDRDAKAICAALLNVKYLEVMNLSENILGPKSISFIDKLMTKTTLITEIDLSNNLLGQGNNGVDGGMQRLSNLGRSHKCIQKINLSGNKINDNDAVHIGTLIKDSPHLWELDLSHNQLREKGGMHVGDALRTNDTLYSLDLSWNHLRGRGAECVALGLMKNDNLLKLNLAWNGFGFEGCVAMALALYKNTSLIDLDLTSNRIHVTGLWELWKGLRDNKIIRTLRIGHNPLQTVCTTPFICAIRDSPQMDISLLDLTGVPVSLEFEVVVDEIRETRPDFTVLYDKALPVNGASWEQLLRKNNQGNPVYNIDPVRILFHTKKKLRIIDMFNRMDRDGQARLNKQDVQRALKMDNFELSSSAIDKIFDFVDENGDGFIDLGELYHAERRFNRQVLSQAKAQQEREKLEVERGAADGLLADLGGYGGRFSKTFRPDLSQGPDMNIQGPEKSPSRISFDQLSSSRQSGSFSRTARNSLPAIKRT